MKKYILNLPETFTAQEALLLNDEIVKHNGKEITMSIVSCETEESFDVLIRGYYRRFPKSWVRVIGEQEFGFEKWSCRCGIPALILEDRTTDEIREQHFKEVVRERERAWNAGQRELWNRLETIGAITKEGLIGF